MKITAIEAHNLRGFRTIRKTDFSDKINVFIGPNNAGKSTILNSIFNLQRQVLSFTDVTVGQMDGEVNLYFKGSHEPYINFNRDIMSLSINLRAQQIYLRHRNGDPMGWQHGRFPEQEPNNLIYPYLSKRKTALYTDQINEHNANSVTGNFANLYSKIDRLVTPQFQPANRKYVEACENILGFQVSTLAKGGGKHAVYFIRNLDHIPLTSMGEGVANLLGLITDLCIAENRIFLIEEPENDIHPKALKNLMTLISENSSSNQFFVSTHSNIVMRYLGAVPDSKVFHVTNKRDLESQTPNLYVSTLKEISDDPQERRRVLEDLGYDFLDFDLWSYWLFLEESSAEILIRTYFIKWFVKPLHNRVRTYSTNGVSNLSAKFEDFDKLFVFLHLQPSYKNKVWVMIDGGADEKEVISRLRDKYSKSGWDEKNFMQFEKHDFEEYYPARFRGRVQEVLKISDKKKKRDAKKILLEEVILWIDEQENLAKNEFEESAKDVVDKLKSMSNKTE